MRSFVLVVLLLTLFISSALASDPDPLSDYPNSVSDFTMRNMFGNNGAVSHGPGGTQATANADSFPAMHGQGLTHIQAKMKPCGVNLPHTHPRASETLTHLSGGPLQVGFVDTQGISHIAILHPGDATVFPRGLLHFQLNVGKTTAHYISALNSENPGTLTAGGALLNLPTRAVATALNISAEQVLALENRKLVYGSSLQMAPPSICTPGKHISTLF